MFVRGRGRAGFHSPAPFKCAGGDIFWVIPIPPQSGARPSSFPGRVPICHHQIVTGTRLGGGWGGGLSGDRGRECQKYPPPWAIGWGREKGRRPWFFAPCRPFNELYEGSEWLNHGGKRFSYPCFSFFSFSFSSHLS